MRDGEPPQMTFEALADRVGNQGRRRLKNAFTIHWSGSITISRGSGRPFDLVVDGKVDHCGTDLFKLARVDGRWLIASVADTGTKTCSGK
jgi:hypothetical protein